MEQTKGQLSLLSEEIRKKLQSGLSQDQIAKEYKVTWNAAGFNGRYATKMNPAILTKAFELPRPVSGKSTYGSVQLPSGFAVLAVQAVRDGVAKDDKQRALFAEQIQKSQGLMEYELYRQSVMAKTKVSIVN